MIVKIEIPNLEGQQRNFARFWWKSIWFGSVTDSDVVNSLVITYLRLVDAALIEYELGGAALHRYWDKVALGEQSAEGGRLEAMGRSISHFENCLVSMHRAILAFRRLRRSKELPEELQRHLSDDRPNFVADRIADQLRKMRDAISHLDNRLIDGRISKGEPVNLLPTGNEVPHPTEENQTIKTIDRVALGPHEVTFLDLAEWLQEMVRFATRLFEFDRTD